MATRGCTWKEEEREQIGEDAGKRKERGGAGKGLVRHRMSPLDWKTFKVI